MNRVPVSRWRSRARSRVSVGGAASESRAAFEMDGVVVDVLPNTQFRVRLDNGHELLTYLSGKMRRFRIRIVQGDRVRVELSPYDLTRGRMTYRYR